MQLLRKAQIVAACLAVFATPTVARSQPRRKGQECKQARFRELDFWIGDWKVVKLDHSESAKVTVAPILGGCALTEHWAAMGGNDGRGLSTYNSATQKWEYFWVAANGYTSFWTGRPGENAMRFTAAQPSPGAASLRKWSLTKLPDGRIEEQASFSKDNGMTWATQYTLYWERISPGGAK
jgi:hypothetical protein